MRTAIIVLNWNGIEVLKECMESLMSASGDFFVIVADNASDDGSVHKLGQWCNERAFSCTVVKEGEEKGVVSSGKDILIYSLKENYGFAKGNNIAVKLALQSQPQRVLLLNNDTEVEPDFLVKLEDFQHSNPDCQIHLKYLIKINILRSHNQESRIPKESVVCQQRWHEEGE